MKIMEHVDEGEAFMKHYSIGFWAARNLPGIQDTWEK